MKRIKGTEPPRCGGEAEELAGSLSYRFTDMGLLVTALTHSSYCNEKKRGPVENNEKLEFLGDAVLELSISGYIYSRFPELNEGELTKLRASIVCEATIAGAARALKLGRYLRMGRGEARNCGYDKGSILSDAFEALIGAVFLDGGYECAKAFVLECLGGDICRMRQSFLLSDPKTLLQERIQQTSREPVKYSVIKETGADHNKLFCVGVSHMEHVMGVGYGKSKKEAEQDAALSALKVLDGEPDTGHI